MTSKETDLADRAERRQAIEAALATDRVGRNKLINRANQQPADTSHLDDTPNTGGRGDR